MPSTLSFRLAPSALQKGFRAVVLLQKIRRSLISEFLEAPLKVACESLERKPGFVIELDALALQNVLAQACRMLWSRL